MLLEPRRWESQASKESKQFLVGDSNPMTTVYTIDNDLYEILCVN